MGGRHGERQQRLAPVFPQMHGCGHGDPLTPVVASENVACDATKATAVASSVRVAAQHTRLHGGGVASHFEPVVRGQQVVRRLLKVDGHVGVEASSDKRPAPNTAP